MIANRDLPYPPVELANRVGSLARASDPLEYYDKLGRDTRHGIIEQLPSDWTFKGKRVLDFGCGAGRTLRHFSSEASEAEFCGCDIDEPSIGWMTEHMCPPFQVFVNQPEPPLDQADSSFDLIWAISVFTHLTTNWSHWLMELHRLLKPDALLLVTFMGRGMSQEIAGEPWDDNHFGMNVIKYGQDWDLGGPMVLHSPWWIEEHLGRAFEILSLVPDGFAEKPWLDHGCVLMRKRDIEISPSELEQISPGDARETRALAHNITQLHRESVDLRTGLGYLSSQLQDKERALEEQVADLARSHEHAADLSRESDALRGEAAELHRKTALAQQGAAAARERSVNSARKLLATEEALAQAKARIFALEQAHDELRIRLERADRVTSAMKMSVSWRVTAPLRALKRKRSRTSR